MSFNSNRQKAFGSSVIALAGLVAGTITPTTVAIAPGESPQRVSNASLYMRVSAALTTSAIVATTLWQASDDGVSWSTITPGNSAAYVAIAPAGNGTLITTTYRQWFDFGEAAACQYIRAAVKNTVATGGAGDNVTIAFGWMKRWTVAA